jgi:hypothetical protein
MVGQRIFGIALGYEDAVDHDELRHDPILAVLAGKLVARRKNCAPVAGKSTLNRLELGTDKPTAYHKIGHDAIEALFVDLFLEAYQRAPRQIILDLDATDEPADARQCPECCGNPRLLRRGARSSNPSPSSGESPANLTFGEEGPPKGTLYNYPPRDSIVGINWPLSRWRGPDSPAEARDRRRSLLSPRVQTLRVGPNLIRQ